MRSASSLRGLALFALPATLVLPLAAGCDEKGKEAAATVTGTAAPTQGRARVVVRDQGFLEDETIGYGVVLRNTSTTQDALDITVTTNFVDASGVILVTDKHTINVIPAATTYYHGGETFTDDGKHVSRMETTVTVDDSTSAQYELPAMRNIRLYPTKYLGKWVRGEVENTLDTSKRFGSTTRIGIVLFDSRGRAVGGGASLAIGDLPPGRREAFDTAVNASRTAKYARASADSWEDH